MLEIHKNISFSPFLVFEPYKRRASAELIIVLHIKKDLNVIFLRFLILYLIDVYAVRKGHARSHNS